MEVDLTDEKITTRIQEIIKNIRDLNKELNRLRDNCSHKKIVQYPPNPKKAMCVVCGDIQRYKWCPTSPTKQCWYLPGSWGKNEDGEASDYHDKCKYCGL